MKLIVGLGNPGKEYEQTRHNIGFKTIDAYLKTKNISNFKEKYNGKYAEIIINDEKVIFLKPQKYMNLSGEVVSKFVNFFKLDIDDILVISDDITMDCGKVRLRERGSSGGHNGLKNIELNLETNEYKRLKIGVGANNNIDTVNFVLGKFSNDDIKIIDETISRAINIIDDYFKLDFLTLMNKYN